MKQSLVLAEPPIPVLPSLAVAIGLNAAIVYQQIFFLTQNVRGGREINGEQYVWNTYEQWHDIFPWWSIRTIERIISDLEQRGLIGSCQPDGRMSRKKYYCIKQGMFNQLTYEQLKEFKSDSAKMSYSHADKLTPSYPDKMAGSLTETTTKNTTDINTRQQKGTKVPSCPERSKPKSNPSSLDGASAFPKISAKKGFHWEERCNPAGHTIWIEIEDHVKPAQAPQEDDRDLLF